MAKKLPGNINLNEAMMKNVNIIVESIMEGIFPVIKQYIDQRFQQLEAQKINPISIKETVQSSAKRIFDAEGVGKEHYSNIGGGILKEKTGDIWDDVPDISNQYGNTPNPQISDILPEDIFNKVSKMASGEIPMNTNPVPKLEQLDYSAFL